MIERYRKGLAVTGAALLAALGVGGIAAAQNGSQTPSKPAVSQSQTAAPESTTGPDTDTVQSGDQTTPDKPGAAESANESASEPANEPANESATQESSSEVANDDGPGGHADEPANPNADHQAQGVE
ncbi:MAG: hypothetical protein QOI98_2455 [Solirubrobacteraceae bacterium]|nr:hypothetical protein [Solirubrobacteraceae bacterium]